MTRRFVVAGRVQGVGFRWYTSRAARRLGVTGYVSNLPDGRVEIVASGTEERLRELALQLHAGPPGAAVSGVDVSEVPGEDDRYKAFEIR